MLLEVSSIILGHWLGILSVEWLLGVPVLCYIPTISPIVLCTISVVIIPITRMSFKFRAVTVIIPCMSVSGME